MTITGAPGWLAAVRAILLDTGGCI